MPHNKVERPRDSYRGRFAPSPSGLLHFGSLVTALASYLDAKANNGIWLVRIEDIDPPREQEGAADAILRTLEKFGLYWDESVMYQSQQSKRYDDIIAHLFEKNLAYFCQCTRAQIKAAGGIYKGHCRTLNKSKDNSAIRVINNWKVSKFVDLVQGHVQCNKGLSEEDFIIFRKDGLYAYQLAVVADEIEQGITHIIRGADLLEPTARQLSFFECFDHQAPLYGHIPLAVTDQGYKLSKQNKAPAIDVEQPQQILFDALNFLGQAPDPTLKQARVDEIISQAISSWQLSKVPQVREIEIG